MSQAPSLPEAQVLRILHTVDLFEMLADGDLSRVLAAGERRRLGPGEVLFRAGDPPDRIFILLEGVIEIVRTTPDHPEPVPVAYVSPGEAVGDMALFTGSARRSTGRVPERAEVLVLNRPSFERITRAVPGYGIQLATVFARRLEGFINHLRGQARRKELSGRLKFFDLPTVVQTLVSSNQTGILTLLDDAGKTLAEVLLVDGAVTRARCGALEGEDAFYQLFLSDDAGEFHFRTVPEPSPDTLSRVPIALSAMNLLMEAMRLKDELPSVRGRLPDLDRPYQARTDHLRWEDDRTIRVAHEILAKLKNPRKIGDLAGEIPCSTFTLYQVAADLYETNQIAQRG